MWRKALSWRWLPIVLAVLLSLPSLRFGLVADDYWHRAFLKHDTTWVPVQPGKLWLFSFADGNPAGAQTILEAGFAPWWFSPELRIAFFRPIASLTHAFDYLVWPASPLLMHVHSIAWYVAIVVVVGRLFRRMLPGFAGGLAALIFAIDHTHGLPIAWLANRNALVAATFAFASLAIHHDAARAREDRRSWRRSLLSAAFLALALGSGESAVAILAYLGSHALFLDDRPARTRLLSLAPHAAVTLVWVVVYRAFRFGVYHSGIYVDPTREPLGFLKNAATSLPLLVASELGGPTPDVYPFSPSHVQAAFVIVALVVVAWSAVAIGRLLRAEDAAERRLARFFAVGAVVSVLPACATFPSARLLLISGFGLVGLVAMVAYATIERARSMDLTGARKALARSFAVWACGGHVILSPLVFQVSLHQMVFFERIVERYAKDVPTDPDTPPKRLVLVNAPETAFAYYLVVTHIERGEPAPRRLLMLAGASRDVHVTREAERTLLVRVDQGFYRTASELLYRPIDAKLPLGTTITLTDLRLTITKLTPDGVPEEVRFTFDHPLEGDRYVLRASDANGLVPFVPPPIGQTVTFAGRTPTLM